MANVVQRFVAKTLGLVTQEEARDLALGAHLGRAKGSADIASGVKVEMGRFTYEALTEFGNTRRTDTLDRMEADTHVKDVLDAAVLPLLTGKWEVQPASDKARDLEVRDFVAAVLLRENTERYGREFWCETSPEQRRLEECDALRVGFSVHIPTWGRVKDKLIYARTQWIEPDTIDPYRGWELDDADRILGMRRQYKKPGGYFETGELIGAERIRLFVWDGKGARYEGRSLLRSIYGPWFRKDFFLRQAMAWAQKAGAPAPVGVYPAGWKPEEIETFTDFVKAMRGTSPTTAYGVFPRGTSPDPPTVNFAGVDKAEIDRMRGLIDGENAEIGHGGKTKSKSLGETATGSRAVGESQSEDEDVFREAVARWLVSQENHGYANLEGWVEPLVTVNFAGVRDCPKIVVSRIGPREDRTAVTPLIQVWSSKAPVEVKKAATERLGFAFDEAFYDEQEAQAEEARAMMQEAAKGLAEGDDEDAGAGEGREPSSRKDEKADDERSLALAVPSRVLERIRPLLKPREGAAKIGTGHRPPNALEAQVVQLSAVQQTLEDGQRDLHQELRVVRDQMIADLMGRQRAGKIIPRNVPTQRRSKFRGDSKAHARLVAVLERIGAEGAEQVEQELTRGAS
jgi:hypothetical protein